LALCSFTAPIGWPTTIAALRALRSRFLGRKRLPATCIRYWSVKVTFSTVTSSLT
jgi:hypothetical protein